MKTLLQRCLKRNLWGYLTKDVLRALPFIWLSVVAVVVITYVPAEWLTNKFVKMDKKDKKIRYNLKILNIKKIIIKNCYF